MSERYQQLLTCAQQAFRQARLESMPLPDCQGLKLYLLNSDFASAELDADEIDSALNEPLYWLFCWASGHILARTILHNPEMVRGKVVADVGAGSGVVAIACALAGAAKVYAVDIDSTALEACLLNAEHNGVSLEITTDLNAIAEQIDLITVADVLYDRDNIPLLPLFFSRAPEVLLADSRLKVVPDERYLKLGEWPSSTLPDLDEHAEFRSVRVYRAAR